MNQAVFQPDVVACLDVGSPKKNNVGWAVVRGDDRTTGRDIVAFVDALGNHLTSGRTVAVGFECPLYVPKREDATLMTGRRLGEGSLNWCGGPGSSVLATGVAQVNWVLSALVKRVKGLSGTTRWSEFSRREHSLFVWEAFITSSAGTDITLDTRDDVSAHEKDALCGALAFSRICPASDGLPSDLHDEPAISLIGLHLLESGLSSDMRLLSETCTVLKVRKPR